MIIFYPVLWSCGFFIGFFAPLEEKEKSPIESDFILVNREIVDFYKQQL